MSCDGDLPLYHKAAGCPVPSQISALRAQGDALRLSKHIKGTEALHALTRSLSVEAMQRMPQRGKGPIETTCENVINKLRYMIVTRQVIVKFLPGQLEVDQVDRGRTPPPILCGSLYIFQRTTAIHTAHEGVEELVAQMHHIPYSSSVAQ